MKHKLTALRLFIGTLALNFAFGLVCFAQTTAGQPQTSVNQAANEQVAHWVAEWTRAKAYTKEYLDAMPADGLDFRPTKDIRSFAEQMLHLAAANFGFVATAAEIPNPYQGKNLEKMAEYTGSKEALNKIVLESYDYVINALPKLNMAKMNDKVKLFGRFDTTRSAALEKCFEHQTHHRGQTTIYLRLKGVTPPNEKLF